MPSGDRTSSTRARPVPRPAGAGRPGPARRGLRRRRGRRAGGDGRGAAGLARAPAARPARVADHGRHAPTRRRPPQRVGAAAPRGDGRTPSRRQGPTEQGDDTLLLLFCCCHPELSPASQVALTLRAVGGLTTREIADAFFVPEATMAQRISRAKRTVRGRSLHRARRPGGRAARAVARLPRRPRPAAYDLAGEAIRLTRQLTLATPEPEARGLLALMLLQHARLPARTDADGPDRDARRAGPLACGTPPRSPRACAILQGALAEQRPGRYQIQAAIAALHADAASAEETDWPQILAWYDDLVALSDEPERRRPRRGAQPRGRRRPRPRRRRRAARDRAGARRARRPAPVARRPRLPARARRRVRRRRPRPTPRPPAGPPNVAERDHLVRRAARARAVPSSR